MKDHLTPLHLVELAHQLIKNNFTNANECIWWDCCSGTGRLTSLCQDSVVVFNTTLSKYPGAITLDFLNFPKIPTVIQKALETKKDWLFILNPPYRVGQGGLRMEGCKKASDTLVANQMGNMNRAKQNLYGQFLWRILQIVEEYKLNTRIVLFSPISFIVGQGWEEFRNKWYSKFNFVDGRLFSSKEFPTIKSPWPVLLSLWKAGKQKDSIKVKKIEHKNGEIISKGVKILEPAKNPMSKWLARPRKTEVCKIQDSYIITDKETKRNKDSLAFLKFHTNSVQANELTILTSLPEKTGRGWDITSKNLVISLVCFASRVLVNKYWYNNRDEYCVPDLKHEDFKWFIDQLGYFVLSSRANQCISADVRNHMFWLTPNKMRDLDPRLEVNEHIPKLTYLLRNPGETAKKVYEAANDLLIEISSLREKADNKYHLNHWDAGLLQIRRGIFNIRHNHLRPDSSSSRANLAWKNLRLRDKELREELRPMIYRLGILTI